SVDKNWAALGGDTDAAMHRVVPGANYLEVCLQANTTSSASRAAQKGIQAVLSGTEMSFTMDYVCRTSSRLRVFRLCATPFPFYSARVAITHTDITDLQFSKNKRLQQITQRLIHAQENERQRIAQELHDDLSSRIALIAFSIRETIKQERRRFH